MNKRIVFVLPSLDPDERILSLAAELQKAAAARQDDPEFELLVVNDGSSAEKQYIFDRLAELPGSTVLHHQVNRGKGAALKTAFAHLLADGKPLCGCVTADGDGQHLVKDILAVAAELKKKPDHLILGSRVFTGDDVPWKSRFGNNMTRFMFKSVLRLPVSDTQTGLRGIPANLMLSCLKLPGDRFEFETEMLLATKQFRNRVPISELPIETVYLEENAGTHFRPVQDACRIYGVIFRFLFGEFFTFFLSSLSSALLDWLMFRLFFFAVFTNDLTWYGRHPRLFLSTFLARLISSVWNFSINRYVVFSKPEQERQPLWSSLRSYYSLCIVILIASWLSTAGLSHIIPEQWLDFGKAGADAVLFLVCYFVQKYLIFRSKDA